MRIIIFLIIGLFVISAAPLFGSTASTDTPTSSRGNQPPTVNITNPENEATVNGTITIQGTASDDVSVKHVKMLINEVHYLATDTSGNSSWATWNYTLDTTLYKNGELKVTAFSSDGTHTADDHIWLVINNTDEEKPKCWIGTPANNTEVSGWIAIRGHATDDTSVRLVDLVIDENEHKATDTSGNDSWYKWVLEFDTTTLENGEYWVYAWAWDNSENGGSDKILIIVNNTKENHWPYVEITHPANEATVSGEITIKGKAWDPDGNVTKVYVIINEVHYNATDTSGNGTWYTWELKFNTTILRDGEYKVKAISKDDGGKLGDEAIWIVVKNTKENLAPHIEILQPKNEASVSGMITVKGRAWDTDGSIALVKVRIAEVCYNATDTSGNGTWYHWKLVYNTTKLKDGEYKVTAIAWDNKEKAEDTHIWIIVKDTKENKAPHIKITHPKNEATVSGMIVIKGKAWDVDGKIILVKVRIGDTTYKAKDTSGNSSWYNWSLQFNTTKLKNGEHKIGAIAWDDKEKAEDTHIWIIVKNKVEEEKTPNKEPYVYITGPKHHSKVKGVITIKGKSWDLDNNVTKVKVRIYEKWYEAKDTSGNGSWYTWSLEFNTSGFKNGWYKITAAAYDGKAWGDDHIYVYFNNTPPNKCPSVKITHPKADAEVSGNVKITGAAEDDELVKHVKIKIGDKKFLTKDTSGNKTAWSSWEHVWNTSGYENGEYRITAIVSDGICIEDAHVWVFLNNTSDESDSSENESSNESSDSKSDESDTQKSSPSPLPGFEGPSVLVAAAIAAVVVSFFRNDRTRNRAK